MADFSYQSLVNGMQQPAPQPLWNGLQDQQQPPVTNIDPSMLAMMRAKQSQQQDPRVFMREIDPGQTWGGRDRNNITPNDVMQSYFSAIPPENM